MTTLKTIGKLHPARTMLFRQAVGTADGEDGKPVYEMSTNISASGPIVRYLPNGRWFTLNWGDIIALAEQAGIQEEEPLEGEDD